MIPPAPVVHDDVVLVVPATGCTPDTDAVHLTVDITDSASPWPWSKHTQLLKKEPNK